MQTQSGVMTAETGTYRWMAPEVSFFFPHEFVSLTVVHLYDTRSSLLKTEMSLIPVLSSPHHCLSHPTLARAGPTRSSVKHHPLLFHHPCLLTRNKQLLPI